MALSKEEILDAISEMSVMDVVDLVKLMEEKFGVTAAAPVAAAAAPAAGGEADSLFLSLASNLLSYCFLWTLFEQSLQFGNDGLSIIMGWHFYLSKLITSLAEGVFEFMPLSIGKLFCKLSGQLHMIHPSIHNLLWIITLFCKPFL